MKIMDLNLFLEEMDNDYDDVITIVNEFTRSLTSQLPMMEQLYRDKDFPVLTREAHSIKGGARNIMAQGLEFAATDLETAAKGSDIELCEKYLFNLEAQFIRFRKFVSSNLLVNP